MSINTLVAHRYRTRLLCRCGGFFFYVWEYFIFCYNFAHGIREETQIPTPEDTPCRVKYRNYRVSCIRIIIQGQPIYGLVGIFRISFGDACELKYVFPAPK